MKHHPAAIRARRNRRLAMMAIVLIAAALAYTAYWWLHARFWVVTDNAFIAGNVIPVEADSAGMVAEVLTEESRLVNQGDVLIRLDEQRAQALLGQRAGELGKAVRGIGALFANRLQVCHKLEARSAKLAKVRHDLARLRAAVPSGAASEQALQNAEDEMAALEADQQEALADLAAIEARVGGTLRDRHPDIEAASQQYANAYLDLVRQRIKAPVAGYVAQRKVQVGDRVHPGDALLMVVPLDHLWVEANLRETELEHVRTGQPARITVDLYGKQQALKGSVEGIHPGTGSVFALLPPDNATGNFIHIVQRVPVRIALDREDLLRQPLRPGLSTVAAIDIRESNRPITDSAASVGHREYRSDIYQGELAEAERKADELIRTNLVPQPETPASSCGGWASRHPDRAGKR